MEISRRHVGRERIFRLVPRGWERVTRVWRTGQEGVGGLNLDRKTKSDPLLIDQRDADGLVGASLDASRSFSGRQPAAAKVAFSHDALSRVVLRDLVGTFPETILATNTLIVEMADDAGGRIFFVGVDWAAVQAGGINAVMAGGGDRLLDRLFAGAAVQQSHRTPRFVFIEAI